MFKKRFRYCCKLHKFCREKISRKLLKKEIRKDFKCEVKVNKTLFLDEIQKDR